MKTSKIFRSLFKNFFRAALSTAVILLGISFGVVFAYTWTYTPATKTDGQVLDATSWNAMVNSVKEVQTNLGTLKDTLNPSYFYDASGPGGFAGCPSGGGSFTRVTYYSASSMPAGYAAGVNYCGNFQVDANTDLVRSYNGSAWSTVLNNNAFCYIGSALASCSADILGSKFEDGYIKLYVSNAYGKYVVYTEL